MSRSAHPLRRRVDNVVLRWQARLDSEWSDRVLPWLLAAGLFVLLELAAAARVRSLDGSVDFAMFTQATWLIRHGHAPEVTIGTPGNVLSQQAAFALYPVALLSFLLGTQPALVVLQSAAIALGVVPVWRIARNLANLRAGASLALVAAYALYPALHNVNVDGFYPDTMALPALLYAAYFGLSHHWKRYVACCVLVVLCRADLGLAVAGLGGLLWAEGRKTEGRATLIGGAAYTVAAALVVQPLLGSDGLPHLEAFSRFGTTPLGVLGGMLTHPGEVLGQLTRQESFGLFVLLFAPVAFLPFLAPRYLVPILPLEFFYLAADVPREAVYGRQTIAITAFVFLATAYGLARMGRVGVERVTVDRRVLALLLLASVVFFVRDAASSPYQRPWDWGGRDAVDGAKLRAADALDPDAGVRASSSLLPVLASRERVYELAPGAAPDPATATDGVEAVLFDVRSVARWTTLDRRLLDDGMTAEGFRRTQDDEGILAYERNR